MNPYNYFYHYTPFESCMKIIKSNTLLFGRLKDMNDINELYRPRFFQQMTEELITEAEAYLEKFQQISLTMNDKRLGFDIHSMWGHYANSGNGVCLVLDKECLFHSLSCLTNVYHDKVKYTDKFSPDILFEQGRAGNIKSFTKRKIKDHFFKKTKDWSNEQEYRILLTNADPSKRMQLPLGTSLHAVILHNAPDVPNSHAIFNSNYFKTLSKIFPQDRIWEYGFFLDNRNLRDFNFNQIWPEPIDWDSEEYDKS